MNAGVTSVRRMISSSASFNVKRSKGVIAGMIEQEKSADKESQKKEQVHSDAKLAGDYDWKKNLLSLSEDYCVFNKPANVRMDGVEPDDPTLTVEKILLSTLSTPASYSSNRIGSSSNNKNNSSSSISSGTVTLKWVHQLDYATSGVLCVALNKKAAATAARAFEERKVSKEYLAVVKGHIDLDSSQCQWPLLHTRLRRPLTGNVDKDHKKTKKYVPAQDPTLAADKALMQRNFDICHHILLALREIIDRSPDTDVNNDNNDNNDDNNNANISLSSSNSRKKSKTTITNEQLESYCHVLQDDEKSVSEFQSLLSKSIETFHKENKWRKRLRKLLKKIGIPLETILEEKPLFENKRSNRPKLNYDIDESKVDEVFNISHLYKSSNEENAIDPLIYRCELNDINTNKHGKYHLVINVPITETPGEFRMTPGSINNEIDSKDDKGGVTKFCETELFIMEKGFWLGQPVTKVKLKPRSGRRHQLRVHCLCLGHPIIGDYTYNIDCRLKDITTTNRMMLHAHYLQIPDLTKENESCISHIIDSTSPDPFLFDEKGILKCLS